jgi:hypothetical protein
VGRARISTRSNRVTQDDRNSIMNYSLSDTHGITPFRILPIDVIQLWPRHRTNLDRFALSMNLSISAITSCAIQRRLRRSSFTGSTTPASTN